MSILEQEFKAQQLNIVLQETELEIVFLNGDCIYLLKGQVEDLIQELTELKDKMI